MKSYYYTNPDNQPTGPASFADLQKLASDGVINASTAVISEGSTTWTTWGVVLRTDGPAAAFPPPPPAPSWTPPSPKNPKPGLNKVVVIGAVLALAAAVGVGIWALSRTGRPNFAEITKTLNQSDWPKTWQPVTASVTETKGNGGAGTEVRAVVTARLGEDLFQAVSTDDWLKTNVGLNLGNSKEALNAIRQPQWAKIAPFVRAAPPAVNLDAVTLLKRVTIAGTKAEFEVTFNGEKGDTGWNLTMSQDAVEKLPQALVSHGSPKSAFLGTVFCVDESADVNQLKATASATTTFVAAFNAGFAAFKAELARKRQAAIDAFTTAIAAKTIYRGQGVSKQNSEATPLFLEIVAVKDGNRVSALLRDDAGWAEARPFNGIWSYNDIDDTITIDLSTRGSERLDGCGPILGDNKDWGVRFSYNQGKLAGETSGCRYSFERRSAQEAAQDRAEVEAPVNELLAATNAGAVFKGIGTSKSGENSFEMLLRITRNDSGGIVTAKVEDPNDPRQTRAFKGAVIANGHRNNGWPLRLASGYHDHGHGRDLWYGDLEINSEWKGEGNTLVGESQNHTYSLTKLNDAEQAEFMSKRDLLWKAKSDKVLPPRRYSGHLTCNNGAESTNVLLEIFHYEPNGLIECRISSVINPRVFIAYKGTFSPIDGQMILTGQDKHIDDTDRAFRTALDFGRNSPLRLFVGNGSITNDRTNGDLTLEFPYAGDLPSAEATPTTGVSLGIALPKVAINGRELPLVLAEPRVVQSLGQMMNGSATLFIDPPIVLELSASGWTVSLSDPSTKLDQSDQTLGLARLTEIGGKPALPLVKTTAKGAWVAPTDLIPLSASHDGYVLTVSPSVPLDPGNYVLLIALKVIAFRVP